MKEESIGKKKFINCLPQALSKGFSTLEILISFAVLMLGITAVIIVGFGNQSISVDTQTNNEALYKAQKGLEDARALSRKDFSSVIPTSNTEIVGGLTYTKTLTVADLTECKKQVTSTISWTDEGRPQKIELTTFLISTTTFFALGSDCAVSAPSDGWNQPRLFASYNFNPGQPVSLDILNRIAYVTDDKGMLNIVDTNGATLGFSGPFLSSPFNSTSTFPAIDVAKWRDPGTGVEKLYAYVARGHYSSCDTGDNKDQFEVIDVTNPSVPEFKKSLTLEGLSPPNGSCPGGWRVFYYDNRVYVTTRYTAGYEFHIFNVIDPTDPTELGPGFQIGGTTNSFVVTGATVNGIARRVAFLATDRSQKEIMVLNVTDATTPVLLTSIDLGTTNNALSIYIVGKRLYVGRQNTSSGPELYVYDIVYGIDPVTGKLTVTLNQVGAGAEIGADVDNIRVSGNLAFLSTSLANDEFQVWNIGNPSLAVTRNDTDPIKLPNKIVGGIDYEFPYLYLGSQATDPLQILYSVPPNVYSLTNSGDITVTQGFSGNNTVTRTLVSGTPSNITLNTSGLPAGATATFTNNPCSPTCASTLTISTTGSTPVGIYPITVNGSGSVTTTFNLVVNPGPFDYSLTNNSGGSINVKLGASGSLIITSNLVSGLTQPVSLSISSVPVLPATVALSLNNNPCSPACSNTLTINVSATAPKNTSYTVTITGSPSDVSSHTTSFTLNIKP